MSRAATASRRTRETQITASIDLDDPRATGVSTTLPFFDHMLSSFCFHGRFGLRIEATGDTEVDPHHLVEDTGIVLGSCLEQLLREGTGVARFGHSVIVMDEAMSEAAVDVCGRPTLVYRADFPQTHAGSFPLWTLREFFAGLSIGARISLHLTCRYGENAHHMAEALFKALGRAIAQAYAPGFTPPGPAAGGAGETMSTKGTI